jgi:hypothetical protein
MHPLTLCNRKNNETMVVLERSAGRGLHGDVLRHGGLARAV